MRCPKCGYISFDHNQACPKCNKDISGERDKLNLPSYKFDPPSLLGMLTGEGNESNVGFSLDSSVLNASEMDMDFNQSAAAEVAFGEETQEPEIDLNADDSGDFELPEIAMDEDEPEEEGQEDEISLDMNEISLEDSNDELAITPDEDEGDEINLDLGDISSSEDDIDLSDISIDEDLQAEEDSGIELGDIDLEDESADDEALPQAEDLDLDLPGSEDDSLDLGDLSIDTDAESGDEEDSEIELDLGDLKVGDTGELEISSFEDAVQGTPDQAGETDVKDDMFEAGGPGGGDEENVLDLSDSSEDELDLSELFDEGDMNAEQEDPFSGIDLDDSGEAGDNSDVSDDELTIDLENLDIDLDLDDTDKK